MKNASFRILTAIVAVTLLAACAPVATPTQPAAPAVPTAAPTAAPTKPAAPAAPTVAPTAAPTAAPTKPAAPAAPTETYIYVSSMGNLEFFNAHKYGWAWAGKALGVNSKYVGPAEVDINGEVAAFDQAIAEKPAGIAVFAWDPVLTPQINKAWDAGIPVVTILGDLPESKRIAYVGSPQRDLGYVGGLQLAKVLGGKGKVVILSIPGSQMFDDRAAGFVEAFKKYPGIQVVQTVDTKADTVTAINAAKSMLQRFPDLAAFVGTDSTAGIGAATAVKEAGKAGQVKIVLDGSQLGCAASDPGGDGHWLGGARRRRDGLLGYASALQLQAPSGASHR